MDSAGIALSCIMKSALNAFWGTNWGNILATTALNVSISLETDLSGESLEKSCTSNVDPSVDSF